MAAQSGFGPFIGLAGRLRRSISATARSPAWSAPLTIIACRCRGVSSRHGVRRRNATPQESKTRLAEFQTCLRRSATGFSFLIGGPGSPFVEKRSKEEAAERERSLRERVPAHQEDSGEYERDPLGS